MTLTSIYEPAAVLLLVVAVFWAAGGSGGSPRTMVWAYRYSGHSAAYPNSVDTRFGGTTECNGVEGSGKAKTESQLPLLSVPVKHQSVRRARLLAGTKERGALAMMAGLASHHRRPPVLSWPAYLETRALKRWKSEQKIRKINIFLKKLVLEDDTNDSPRAQEAGAEGQAEGGADS
jgi:hypothetical protein